MKLAIMQPYIFPYIGYFQLIHAVDKFVFYDDVNYIKQGWVNRNRILMNGTDFTFSVPLLKQSSFVKIGDTLINHAQYPIWRKKFLKTLIQAYKKAPFFESVYLMVESVLDQESESIATMAKNSILRTCRYLDLHCEWENSSSIYNNDHLKGQDRVLDICKVENARIYINPTGGRSIYSNEDFEVNNLELYFLQTGSVEYSQFKDPFVPSLSIIDVLMFNPPFKIREEFLNNYKLTQI